MKKSVVLLVVLLALTMVCAAGAQDFKIGYSCNNYNDTFQTVIEAYAKAYAEENGYGFQSADAQNDEMRQQDQIKAFIEDGYDALIVVAVNPMGVDPIIDLAAEAGIPLVFVNRNPFDDESQIPENVYYVGSNEIDAGVYQAQFVVDKLGADAECGYLILKGELSNTATPLRTEGNHQVFDELPGYTLLAPEETANWQRDQGLAKMENWITTYGDQICAVLSNNDEMALGAVEALEAAGMKDSVLVLGVDLIDDAVVAIEEGRLDCSVKQDGKGQGEGAVSVAIAVLNGEEAAKNTVIPFVPVSIDNLEEYK